MKRGFFIAILILYITTSVAFTVQELLPELDYGPYQVGFKTIEAFDNGRTYGFSNISGNNSRPIQISLWYPTTEGKKKPMTYLDYDYTSVTEVDFNADEAKTKSQFRDERIERFRLNKADLTALDQIMNMEMIAKRNSAFMAESFPLIIYNPGGNEKAYENCIMAEYLASYGYVVVSTPSFGTDSRDIVFDMALLESLIADTRFTLSYVKELGIVDNGITVMGFCLGGFVSALFAQENYDVKALIELYGEIGNEESRVKFRKNPYEKLKNPELAYLQLDVSDAGKRDSFLYDQLKYSDAYQFRYNDVNFTSFTAYYLLQTYPFKERVANYDQRLGVYQSLCKNALNFINYHIKGNEKGLDYLIREINQNEGKDFYSAASKRIGKTAPPNSIQFSTMIQSDFDKAYKAYKEAKKENASIFLFKEEFLNVLGYEYLQNGENALAVKIFTLNMEEYPDSWNVYDSLGDAYFASEEHQKAKESYQKSLDLNPENTHAEERIKEIESQ